MTATVPRHGPPAQGGPTAARRFGEIYAYDVRDHHTNAVMPHDYVGQSRVPELRDRQHRGLAPQRDGQVREQPWADRIAARRVLVSGMFTDAELDAEELRLIRTLAPRLNARDNPNPNRIPIYTQHEQRKQRDPTWVIPDWSRRPAPRHVDPVVPPRSFWSWLAATPAARSAKRGLWRLAPWLAVAVAVWVALLFQHVPPSDAAPFAGVAAFGLWAGWRRLTKPKARTRRANTRRRTR